jgi:hypothetical protein
MMKKDSSNKESPPLLTASFTLSVSHFTLLMLFQQMNKFIIQDEKIVEEGREKYGSSSCGRNFFSRKYVNSILFSRNKCVCVCV